MKTNPTSLLRVVVVLAMLGTDSIAQLSESNAEPKAKAEAKTESKVTIEVNGKKIETSGDGGVITVRTDGESIEIDTDGDGKAEERIENKRDENKNNKADENKIAWLGVKTNDVSPELAAQLELDGGAVVEMIVPDSPADKAGVQEHDIITAIGEVGIESPEDLSDAIRALKTGDKTTVTVVRKGKSVDLTATLGERPKMPRQGGIDLNDLDFRGKDIDQIRKQVEKMQKEMLKGMNLRLEDLPMPDLEGGVDIARMSSKTTSFSDGNGSITIRTKDGATEIEAKDAEGNLLYKGPAETEDDRKKLPPEVLEKLERFEKMNVDIDIKGFQDKFLPPQFDTPKLKPAKPKKATSTKPRVVTVA